MDCWQADALLDELALDVLPGDRRAALLVHVESCRRCRPLLDELSGAADALLRAGPVTAPPEGFEDRVLGRIQPPAGAGIDESGADRIQPPGGDRVHEPGVARIPARPRLRVFAAAAVAAALLLVGGVAGGVIGRSGGDRTAASGQEFRTVKLISTGGADVGDVSIYAGSPPWFFMRLEGAVPDGTYRCVLDTDDGRTVPIGRLWVLNGHGGWGEHFTLEPRQLRAARLLDAQGTTLATAKLQ
jgi:hypothetical protein